MAGRADEDPRGPRSGGPTYQAILHGEVELLTGLVLQLPQKFRILGIIWLLICNDFGSLRGRGPDRGMLGADSSLPGALKPHLPALPSAELKVNLDPRLLQGRTAGEFSPSPACSVGLGWPPPSYPNLYLSASSWPWCFSCHVPSPLPVVA